jgi:hypothetical protein
MKRQSSKPSRQPVTANQRTQDLTKRVSSNARVKKGTTTKRARISQSQPHSKTFGH